MDNKWLRIEVFPSTIDIDKLVIPGRLKSLLKANSFSTLDEIRVNKIGDEYAIIYTDDVFSKLNPVAFGENLINTINENLGNELIILELHYQMWSISELFSDECGLTMIQIDDYLEDHQSDIIKYNTSESVQQIYDAYNEESGKFEFEEESDEDGSLPEELDDEEIDPDVAAMLSKYFDLGDVSIKPMKSKSYGSSRVLKSVKNPKKDYKRHGVIVTDSKSAIEKDEKLIKEFLKDFIPGKSAWIKAYRKEILKRWINMYAISKKNLKRMEKAYKKQHKNNSKSKISKESAMNFTRNLFRKDSWSDPNR